MDFSPVSKLSQDTSLFLSAKNPLALKAGEIVEGKVLQVLSGKAILIQLKNQRIEAKTEIPLQPGETIQFQVKLAAGQIRLKRLSLTSGTVSPEQQLAKMLQGFSEPSLNGTEIKRIFTQLTHLPAPIRKLLPDRSLLEHITQNMESLSGEKLKQLFESSGLFFESKLKQQLLSANMQESGSKGLEKALASLLQNSSKTLPLQKGTLLKIIHMLQNEAAQAQVLKPEIVPQALKTLIQSLQKMDEVPLEKLKQVLASAGILLKTKSAQGLMQTEMSEAQSEHFAKAFAQISQGDLKGTLLKLINRLQTQEIQEQVLKLQIEPQELLDSLNAVLNKIAYNQVQSKLEDVSQIFLPFFLKGLNDGSMVFRKSEEDQSLSPDKRRYACTLHLNLEKAGKLSAHIQMYAGLFYLRFIAENSAFVNLLREQTETLKQHLIAVGIPFGDLSVRHQEAIQAEQALSERIDVRI